MGLNRIRVLGLAGVMALLLGIAGQPVEAQNMKDLEKELQRMVQDLAEQFSKAGAKWQQTLRLGKSDAKDAPVSFMLQHRDGLELSEQQVKELKKLRSRFERESIRREADIKVARMELNELLDADAVDLQKTEKKVRELERLRADQKLSRIRTVESAKAVLLPDQQRKLAVLQKEGAVN